MLCSAANAHSVAPTSAGEEGVGADGGGGTGADNTGDEEGQP
ncbi:hypothetical protein SGL43_06605 [Streptomyces globisporus]|uniref:Uncharacterized protein n=1 Tax=Streptomyces globisporus TaxID=1908 RepID=A0ABN8V9Q3_STRGL|nr:hypothetical protein SGL43_06605 [Streptomyces globisporus]